MVLSRFAVFGDIPHFHDDRFAAFDGGSKMKNVATIHNVPG
jgi:hypothetical protein